MFNSSLLLSIFIFFQGLIYGNDEFIQSVIANCDSQNQKNKSYKSSVEIRTQIMGRENVQKGTQYYMNYGEEYLRQTFETRGVRVQTVFRKDSVYTKHGNNKWLGEKWSPLFDRSAVILS